MNLGHLGINVSDLDRSVAWYVAVLGARRLGEAFVMPDGTRVRFLAVGSFEIEMIEPATQLPADVDSDTACAGFHLGVTVADAEDELARLSACGVDKISEPEQTGDTAVFAVHGPDGELLRFTARGGQPTAPLVGHLGVNVSGVEDAAAWFERYFGVAAADLEAADVPGGPRARTVPAGPAYLELVGVAVQDGP